MDSLSSSRIYTERRIIRLVELSTMIRLTRRTTFTLLTGRNKVEIAQCPRVAILWFQFGLYHVVAPLSFLHSISLASLFTGLSIFG